MRLTNYLSAIFVFGTLSFSGQCQAALADGEDGALERQLGANCANRDSIGDGFCDDGNNNQLCEFDGGDCCEQIHDDWNERCTDCKCLDPNHPNSDVIDRQLAGETCKDNGCGRIWSDVKGYRGECVDMYRNKWDDIKTVYDVSLDSRKRALAMGMGENDTLCRPSVNDKDPRRDCCHCFVRVEEPRPCEDNGCSRLGGLCVNMINANLTSPDIFPRNTVDLNRRMEDKLCRATSLKERHCCDCYLRKPNMPTKP